MNKNDYVFFWGNKPNNRVGKNVLSQWFERSFVVDGITFPTAEHFMMYKKAELFGCTKSMSAVLNTEHPRDVKAIGRLVTNFKNDVWVQKRCNIVFEANLAKFSQHEDLRRYLLSTEGKRLVEASPFDSIWGIGMRQDDINISKKHLWGLNLLGVLLERVRSQLIAGV